MGLPGSRVMTRRWTRLWGDVPEVIDRRLEHDLFVTGEATGAESDDRFRELLRL